jgi:hypothetical protein
LTQVGAWAGGDLCAQPHEVAYEDDRMEVEAFLREQLGLPPSEPKADPNDALQRLLEALELGHLTPEDVAALAAAAQGRADAMDGDDDAADDDDEEREEEEEAGEEEEEEEEEEGVPRPPAAP